MDKGTLETLDFESGVWIRAPCNFINKPIQNDTHQMLNTSQISKHYLGNQLHTRGLNIFEIGCRRSSPIIVHVGSNTSKRRTHIPILN